MTFSLCMIVKNEERVLARCLDSLKDVMDEIIIVDTGSSDSTKKIAANYTDKIYDFEWIDDFSAARNFAFSKASGDYIYSADADEYIEEESLRQLKLLKEALLDEIEIVQMVYVTRAKNHPTENFEKDLRPKLFKRIRTFNWIEPIHETVNLNPVVFDSEIEIIHEPEMSHAGRDFRVFEKTIEKNGILSDRLLGMYTRELYRAGDIQDLEKGKEYFEKYLEEFSCMNKMDMCRQVIAVLLKYYRLSGNESGFLKMTLLNEANVPSSEICMQIGYYFMEHNDANEAVKWFYEAANNAECDMDINSCQHDAYEALAKAYRALPPCDEFLEKAQEYEKLI